MDDWIDEYGLLDRDLIFVVMEGKEADKVAFESNLGIIVFGNDVKELEQQILAQVRHFFQGKYRGKIHILEFFDTFLEV